MYNLSLVLVPGRSDGAVEMMQHPILREWAINRMTVKCATLARGRDNQFTVFVWCLNIHHSLFLYSVNPYCR